MSMEMELPMDWDNWFDQDESTLDVHAESIPDGFVKCLKARGCVDIEYIASICDTDYQTVIEKLKGSIYQNPDTWGDCFFKGWETAEEYLSGNIRRKLRSAKEASRFYPGRFEENLKALKAVKPPMVSASDIFVTLGTPWIPTAVIREFVFFITGVDPDSTWWGANRFAVRHDEITGSWEIDGANSFLVPYEFNQRYGTGRRNAFDILLRTLNMQSVAVTDVIASPYTKSGKQTVVNRKETVLAIEKQKLLIQAFKDWVWTDPKRKDSLVSIYEDRYACIRQRHYDGSFLDFPGMDPSITMYPYQRNAVARIIFSPNTLLAHDVGSGKTFIMVAAGMELRRMKLSAKNMYVVPNNIVGQWERIFYSLYPNAYIKCVEPKDFTPAKRNAVLADIRDNDYDAIIMAYSCFNQISISKERKLKELEASIAKLKKATWDSRKTTQRGRNLLDKLEDKHAQLEAELMAPRVIIPAWKGGESVVGAEAVCPLPEVCFDELGITRLFVDEAHNFKNVPIDTKIENVMGISRTGSAKCQDMLDKVRIVQSTNGGGGVIMATGTPITNSITDAYICQQYLQSGELAILGLQNFDGWVGMFAEKTTSFEVDVDTSNYRLATRFAKFHNIPELTALLAGVADFHSMDETQGVPAHDGYQDRIVVRTKAFGDYLKLISQRAEDVRAGRVSRKEDNMLKITTDGRKAALDLRLVQADTRFTPMSKVFTCASNVARIYKETEADLSTQLIFCDTSTPKEGFNIYDELRSLLRRLGVRDEDIAYIHDATTDAKREKLYAAMRSGMIRVLIGSTFKLGLGVNVQDKLIALHHLDVPWRPADMVQREGRILRQGNENPKVEIYRYITEGSFDAYSWQLLETKQRFITDILSGTAEQRSGADVDDTVLNYAEVKALAVGNPLIKERVEVSNELSKYMILQQKLLAQRQIYQQELMDYPASIERISGLIPKVEADAAEYARDKHAYTPDERRDIRLKIHAASHPEEPTTEEVVVTEYQGFRVVVPARVSQGHPVIFLRRNGQYMVELGASDVGNMTKIDNYLEDLTKRHEDLVKKLQDLESRKAFMERELSKEADYSEDIDRCKERLAELDKRLGVGKE